VARVRAAHPDAVVETWCHDQARRGLKPVLRRVWAPRGRRPVAVSAPRYEWLYIYAFAHPPSGRSEWWLLPTVGVEVMNLALAACARDMGLGTAKRIVLVLDRAGWHTSPELVVPEGLHVVHLPPHTPELQPAERLWPLLNEGLANRDHADLAALEERAAGRCRELLAQPELVRAHTRYHWWPDQ
jgi:hypothetical protein